MSKDTPISKLEQKQPIVTFQGVPEIMRLFGVNSFVLRKREKTNARLPSPDELGTRHYTYIKDQVHGKVVKETGNVITDDVVIASNPLALGFVDGRAVYNEWLVPKGEWLENYGVEATLASATYQKVATIDAIKIDDRLIKMLGSKDGRTALIAVPWSESGMIVVKGGYLAKQGYAISPDQIDTYERLD